MMYRLIKEPFTEALKKSGKKQVALSYAMTNGDSENYIGNRLRKEHYQKLTREELEKLASMIDADPDKIAVPEDDGNQTAPSSEIVDMVWDMAKTLRQIAADVTEIRAALATPNREIPVTKRDRAIAMLRKELVSKNGGGVKVEEFKKMLMSAGIGSSYMQDAINELGCKRMLGNNGINYIVKDEF